MNLNHVTIDWLVKSLPWLLSNVINDGSFDSEHSFEKSRPDLLDSADLHSKIAESHMHAT